MSIDERLEFLLRSSESLQNNVAEFHAIAQEHGFLPRCSPLRPVQIRGTELWKWPLMASCWQMGTKSRSQGPRAPAVISVPV